MTTQKWSSIQENNAINARPADVKKIVIHFGVGTKRGAGREELRSALVITVSLMRWFTRGDRRGDRSRNRVNVV